MSYIKYYENIKSLFFLLSFILILISCKEKEILQNDALVVCGDSKVLIIDYPQKGDSIPNILWEWDARYSKDLPFEYRIRKFNTIDDCKPTADGSNLMISSSSGAIAVIHITDQKVTFLADVPNAHSIEMIPNNRIVAAASTSPNGNKLMLFDLNKPQEILDTDSLYSAHGVVWDKKRFILYALGYDELREYEISDENKFIKLKEWTIPGISGHDLSISPDGNKLLITEHTGAWMFDIEYKKFSKIYNFPDAENIKSINLNKKGQFIYTVAEDSWWTYNVKTTNPIGHLSFPNLRLYKSRLYNLD
jgi:hypothetical protein